MLVELAHYLTTPAPWRHRRLGYVHASASLAARSRRCRRAWTTHLAAARATILEAAAGCERKERALVLGSGCLDDVPIAALAAAFDSVTLLDVVHPWRARWRTSRLHNVVLVSADVSGTADLLSGRTDDLTDPWLTLADHAGADLVVSANLLSQLPILPLDRLGDRAADDLGARIVRAHLATLPRLGGRICLVTDTEAEERGRDGAVRERYDLLHGVAVGHADRRWDWELAPFGEESRRYRVVHRVIASSDWRPLP